MSAILVSPQNKIIDVDSSAVYIEWIATQPQYSFEVQYKLHKNNVWSTCGEVVNSNTRKYSVLNIYNLVNVDFYEIYYRLVIKYSGSTGIGFVTGTEISPTYSLIFRHGIVNTLKLYDGVGTLEYPINSIINVSNGTKNEVNTAEITKGNTIATMVQTPVVADGHPMASNLNIALNNSGSKMHPVTQYAAFTTPAEYGSSYFHIEQYYNAPTYRSAKAAKYTSDRIYRPQDTYNYNTPVNDIVNNFKDISQYAVKEGGITNYPVYQDKSVNQTATEVRQFGGYCDVFATKYYITLYGDTFGDFTYHAKARGTYIYTKQAAVDYEYYEAFADGWSSTYAVYGAYLIYSNVKYSYYESVTSPKVYHSSPKYYTYYSDHMDKTFGVYQLNRYIDTTKYLEDKPGVAKYYYTAYGVNDNYSPAYVKGAPKLSNTYYKVYAGLYNSGGGSYAGYYKVVQDNATSYYNHLYQIGNRAYSNTQTYGYNIQPGDSSGHPSYYNYTISSFSISTYLYKIGITYNYNDFYSYYSYNVPKAGYYSYASGVEYYIIGYNFQFYNKYSHVMHSYVTPVYWYTAQYYGYYPDIGTASVTEYASEDDWVKRDSQYCYTISSWTYNAAKTYYVPQTTTLESYTLFSGYGVDNSNYTRYQQARIPSQEYNYNLFFDDVKVSSYYYYYYNTGNYLVSTTYTDFYYHI